MRIYVISLLAGVLVGVIYGLLNVRSPAPPIVALVGLLGILLGEQIVPVAKRIFAGESVAQVWSKAACHSHLFGRLPGNRDISGPG
jgi:XapX domain-containing protein